MEEESMKDFILESKGQCFLCLNKSLHSSPNPTVKPELVYSLQCLSRYLKLDLGKMFCEKWSVPSHLLSTLNMCRLQVELCNDCGRLNDKFSKLFLQLEKVKMEVKSCLSLIHEKLSIVMGANETEVIRKSLNDPISNSKGELEDAIEIMDELRTNAVQQCCRKLTNVGPRVKVKKLDIRKYVKSQKPPVSASSTVDGSEFRTMSELRELTEGQIIKMENPAEAALYYDDTTFAQDQFNETSAHLESDEDEGAPMMTHSNKMECYICHIKVSDLPTHLNKFHFQTENPDVKREEDEAEMSAEPVVGAHREIDWGHSEIANSGECKIEMEEKVKKRNKRETSKEILPYIIVGPVNSNLGSAKLRCTVNSDTGNQTCNLCSKEFMNVRSFRAHYKSDHLKFKYVCKTCNRNFPRGDLCVRHYRSRHMALTESKYKCLCGKRFSRKDHLTKHERRKICRPGDDGLMPNFDKHQQAAKASYKDHITTKKAREHLKQADMDICDVKLE